MASSASSSGGIGLGGLLLVAFIVLRLCGVIAWSWWWVLSPLWIPMGILGVIVVISLAIVVIKRD